MRHDWSSASCNPRPSRAILSATLLGCVFHFETHFGCTSTQATFFGCIIQFATYIGCTMTQTRTIAVLTGDLVGSTTLGPEKVEQAFEALEACADMQAAWMDGQSLHFTRHRGDGWQVALAEPKYALRSALCFRAALRSLGKEFDSYIGIAEGEIEGEIGPDLNEETAEVFARSGAGVEDLKTSRTVRMIHQELGLRDQGTIFADKFVQDWTPIQAETILVALLKNSPNYSDIANHLGKSRQTVSKTLKAAGWEFIELGLETALRDADNA